MLSSLKNEEVSQNCFVFDVVTLFRHLNFQKWSEREVFLAFSLANVLRAKTACTFSTSQLPKVVRTWACFLAFSLANVLRATTACTFSSLIWPDGSATRRFSEPTFRPSGATNHWKTHSVSRLSYLFAHLDLLSSDSFSSLIFSLLLFSSLSGSSRLCSSSVHIVGSLTSKLPSITLIYGMITPLITIIYSW